MSGSATEIADAGETGTFDAPRTLSKDGEWIGSLSGDGNADYFVLNGQANRSMAVEITALDENGNVTEQKARPVIGMWSLAAPDGTPPPAYTFSPFNIGHPGVTRLSAELLSGAQFRIGISDLRGDGRPDYRYRAHVLYGDSVTPARVSVQAGTPIALAGLGFKPGDTVAVGGTNSTLVGVSPTQLTALAPPLVDGVQSITITDPANGASTTLENAVTAGAGPNDLIRMILSGNSPTPVGGKPRIRYELWWLQRVDRPQSMARPCNGAPAMVRGCRHAEERRVASSSATKAENSKRAYGSAPRGTAP